MWRAMVLAMVVVGCGEASEADSAVANVDERTIGRAAVDGSYDLTVQPAAGEVTDRELKAFRLEVPAGQSVAALVRYQRGDELDAWLRIHENGVKAPVVASEYGQAFVPLALESDAAAIYTAAVDQEVLLFAADRELDAATSFQLDIVPVPPLAASLTLTSAATRALTEDLRRQEPRVSELIAAGALEEGADGFVVSHPQVLGLQQRAELARIVAEVNDTRRVLFDELARAHGGDATSIGVTCGELWRRLRDATHALR